MNKKHYEYLRSLAENVLQKCRIEKDTQYFNKEEKMKLFLPSSDEKYFSFWVRDCQMVSESGLMSDEELKKYVSIIAGCGQNGDTELQLDHGLTVPPYTIADHINYNGKPVFFPGTYGDSTDQGTGNYGVCSPLDDNYYFILLVHQYICQTGDKNILFEEFSGMKLIERIEKAFLASNVDDKNQLCYCPDDKHTVDWGFADQISKSGYVLMTSLLRFRAAETISEMLKDLDEQKSAAYQKISSIIQENIIKVFYDDKTGWMYSATGTGKQHDVWCTAYAVYIGLLAGEKLSKAVKSIAESYINKTAVSDGYIRQILTDEDFSENSAWEKTFCPFQEYQNGGYWATPTGWYIVALHQYDEKLCEKFIDDFIKHTEKYSKCGAPFEWKDVETTKYEGKGYGTSGVLPYIGAKKISPVII